MGEFNFIGESGAALSRVADPELTVNLMVEGIESPSGAATQRTAKILLPTPGLLLFCALVEVSS
jgi:hypothetical protein